MIGPAAAAKVRVVANPCHCAARLGNALGHGLIAWPEHEHEGSFTGRGGQTFGTVSDLYANLPRVRLPVVQ